VHEFFATPPDVFAAGMILYQLAGLQDLIIVDSDEDLVQWHLEFRSVIGDDGLLPNGTPNPVAQLVDFLKAGGSGTHHDDLDLSHSKLEKLLQMQVSLLRGTLRSEAGRPKEDELGADETNDGFSMRWIAARALECCGEVE